MNMNRIAPATCNLIPTNSTTVLIENLLDNELPSSAATSEKHSDSNIWQQVPVFSQVIVDLLSTSGLPQYMIDRITGLAPRVLHGEDFNTAVHSADDFWDEVPELLKAIVSVFVAHRVPNAVADRALDVARRRLLEETLHAIPFDDLFS